MKIHSLICVNRLDIKPRKMCTKIKYLYQKNSTIKYLYIYKIYCTRYDTWRVGNTYSYSLWNFVNMSLYLTLLVNKVWESNKKKQSVGGYHVSFLLLFFFLLPWSIFDLLTDGVPSRRIVYKDWTWTCHARLDKLWGNVTKLTLYLSYRYMRLTGRKDYRWI